MEALGYLTAAYGAVVLGVGGYVTWLALRAHRVRAALASIEHERGGER